jgi:CHAT domain-containing protein
MKKYFTILGFWITFLFCLQMNAQAVDSLDIYFQKQKREKEILNLEIKIRDFNINSENKKSYTKLLRQLGYVYIKTGNYIKAEENLLKSYIIIEESYRTDIEYYIDQTNVITQFYLSINDLSNADFYAQKGYEATIDTNYDKKYLNFLSIKASIKNSLGDYENAYILYLDCIPLAKEIYGSNSYIYGSIMGNMGDLMIRRNEYENAKRCYLINYFNTLELYGENHIETANILHKLSNLYVKLNNYPKALEENLKAHQIITQLTGENSPDYATSCYNLACIYALLNDFKTSEKYYLESYKTQTDIYGSENTNTLSSLKSLVILYDKTNLLPNKIAFLLKYLELISFKIKEIESNFSQKELILLSKSIASKNYTPNSFLQKFLNQHPEINIGSYENELLIKNLSLRNQQRIANSIQKSGYTTLKEKYQQFMSNKRQLNKWNELALNERPSNYEDLSMTTETLEKELTRLSSNFAEAKNALSVNWKQIQEKLKPHEIAIDLVAFNYYNKKWTDSIVYGAFVVKKDSKFPKYISLFEQKQLKFLLAKNKNETDNTKIDNQYSDKAIRDLFLKPLEKELDEISTLYLSPSGLGHQINFSALPVSETQTLGDKYSVHILGSTAEIVNYKTGSLAPKMNLELMLYGNIDYNKSDATNKVISDTLATNNVEFTVLTDRSSATTKFEYLAGSKIEINKINALAQQNNFTSVIIDDKKATEESIKALDGRTTPFVLHLATHGFFFPDPKQELPKEHLLSDSKSELFKTAEDPMMRSGLLFSGANKYWVKGIENLTTEDGILTASEISNLDLSACQLVVLSACETGLGDINGSEGVFGLQRAFKMAGVKNIIMSLWKVPDVQTAELFDVFYRECFTGKTIHDAFQTAQAKIKVKYSPYYWAGFVLLE